MNEDKTKDISQSEKLIDKCVSMVGGTEDGRLWMEQLLDPFTDTPKRKVGYPDLITGRSIVQAVPQTFTYTNTSGSAQDVHIFMDNIDAPLEVQQIAVINDPIGPIFSTNSFLANTSGTVVQKSGRGGVRCRAGSVGAPLTQLNDTGLAVALSPNYYNNGMTRTIAKGFEIHNTSNKLVVGGSVAVYRDSTSYDSIPSGVGNIIPSTSTPQTGLAYPLYRGAKVPTTLAECFVIQGTQQWEAEKGCYCVMTMNAQDNNPYTPERAIYTFKDSSNDQYSAYITSLPTNYTKNPLISQVVCPSPFFVGGAYFTGLPAGTVLTVNAIWYIERFVDQTNLDLVVLTQPSPSYDPASYELYSRAACQLPVGTYVCNNDGGDWIKSAADVLSTFGVPGMPIVKGAVDVYKTMTKTTNPVQRQLKSIKKKENEIEREILPPPQRKPQNRKPQPIQQNKRARKSKR